MINYQPLLTGVSLNMQVIGHLILLFTLFLLIEQLPSKSVIMSWCHIYYITSVLMYIYSGYVTTSEYYVSAASNGESCPHTHLPCFDMKSLVQRCICHESQVHTSIVQVLTELEHM